MLTRHENHYNVTELVTVGHIDKILTIAPSSDTTRINSQCFNHKYYLLCLFQSNPHCTSNTRNAVADPAELLTVSAYMFLIDFIEHC